MALKIKVANVRQCTVFPCGVVSFFQIKENGNSVLFLLLLFVCLFVFGKSVTYVAIKTNQVICKCYGFSVSAMVFSPRSGKLQTQKLNSHLVRTRSLNVLPFKPGVGRCMAIHATLTARKFFLAYFYPSSPFTCIFSKTSPNFFLFWPAE